VRNILHRFCGYVTAMISYVVCSSDGESTVLRFITANKASIPQFCIFFVEHSGSGK